MQLFQIPCFKPLAFVIFVVFIAACTYVSDQSGVTEQDIKKGRTASFTLLRNQTGYVAILARVNVYINEIPMGNVGNGEEKTFHFFPTSDGTVKVRLESSDIDWGGISEALAKDSTITRRFRKEFEITAPRGQNVKYFCSLDTKELLVREIESTAPSPPKPRSTGTPAPSRAPKPVPPVQKPEPKPEDPTPEPEHPEIKSVNPRPPSSVPVSHGLHRNDDNSPTISQGSPYTCTLLKGNKGKVIRQKSVKGPVITLNYSIHDADILSKHPENTYVLEPFGQQTKIRILNSSGFWSGSRELRIRAKKESNDFMDKDLR